MVIRLLAIGNRMPDWVTQGFNDYAKRLSHPFSFQLIELPSEKRTKHIPPAKLIARESEKLLAAVKPNHLMIALHEEGTAWTTKKLATQLQKWQDSGQSIDFIIGGPDGLSDTCLQKAHLQWSLSPLTLPHPLVRIVVVEQIYRAVSILQGHPYHRD